MADLDGLGREELLVFLGNTAKKAPCLQGAWSERGTVAVRLAVKDNQETLAEDIREAFATAAEADFEDPSCQQYHTSDKGDDRIEERSYYTMPTPETLSARKRQFAWSASPFPPLPPLVNQGQSQTFPPR